MAKAKKKQDIDIDDLIEERVGAILSERLAEIESGSSPVKEDGILFLKVFCGDCSYWEVSSYQEDNTRINGVCHENPMLSQRKATDWCAKGEYK